MRSSVVFLTLAGLVPAVAHADATVTVALTDEGKVFAAGLGKTPEEMAADIKQSVDTAYQTANIDGFLRSFTDATAFSQRGIGVDYASVPKSYMVGIAGNVAAASDSVLESKQRPTAGAAVNFAAMFGANLGEWGHPRWNLFASGFYQGASTDQLSGHITSAGAHVQYRVLEAAATGGVATAVRWLGLDVTSGIEFTRWTLGGSNLTNTYHLDGTGGGANVDVDSVGSFDLTSNAVTIPVEVTTGLRIALIASLFVGVGVDLTAGQSKVDGHLTGDVNSTMDPKQKIGTVTLDATGSNTASPAAGRILAGAQLNLWKVKIFVQGNVSQTPAASVAFGIRLVL